MTDPLYRIGREVTDEVMGAGAYAEANRGNPDPHVQEEVHLSKPLPLESFGFICQRYAEATFCWTGLLGELDRSEVPGDLLAAITDVAESLDKMGTVVARRSEMYGYDDEAFKRYEERRKAR
jgi:hypothetical protein